MEKVKEYILDNRLIEKDDKVLVALSGGPDSVCLLHILHTLKDELGIELGAIHINHLLRGDEALKDEEYTKKICENLRIQWHVKRIDINKISNDQGISLELAGREERYKAFEEIKEQFKYTKIAVAHNSNDQAETILMRMMRGSGLEGLTGIKPKRQGGIIRPILCMNREEIEKYCEINKLYPRIDESNYEKIYNRNKVRLDIIPYMKENFNEEIVDTLNRMAILLQKDNEYIEEESKKKSSIYCIKLNDQLKISKKLFEIEKEAIITRVVKNAFKMVSNSHQNFEMKHIYEMVELSKRSSGKSLHLTNNVIAENIYGDIVLKIRDENKEYTKSEEIQIRKEDIPTKVEFNNNIISFEVANKKNNIDFSNNDLIKYFNYDNIEESIVIRNRKDGDKMKPIGMKGSKKLKDIFINLKIPRDERDLIPIVCLDDKISWIVGYKVSEDYKITNETMKILKISVERKE